MSCRRTPPEKTTHTLSKPTIMTQESDTASDWVSEPDNSLKYNTQRPKRKHGDTTLAEIKDMLADVKLQQTNQTKKFDEEMGKMLQQNNEIKQSIQYMSEKHEDILNQLRQVKTENTVFKKQIKLLEQKVESLERNSKATFLEIKNVPQNLEENKSTLVVLTQNIGQVLDVPVLETDILNIYRTKKIPNKISPIIIEFTTTSIKEKIIEASKSFNKTKASKLNTSHLKLKGQPTPVYISECLTAYGRRLYFLARECVKKYQYPGCWTTKGKVYVRTGKGLPAVHITCEEDIINLKQE